MLMAFSFYGLVSAANNIRQALVATPRMLKAALIAVLVLLAVDSRAVLGAQRRDPVVRAEFQRQNPCPSTGKTSGACPGWQRDHRIPLRFYGPDAIWNIQWLTLDQHREKTRLDVKVCRWDGK